MFLLHCFRYVLRRFRIQIFRDIFTVAKNVCSIVLEICHTPNPTLNLPDSVGKCKTDLKTHVLMQSCYLNFLTCRFELFCRTIARDSKRSFYLLKYISVLCELTRSTAIVSHISLKKFKEEHRRESWYLLCCEGATPEQAVVIYQPETDMWLAFFL